MGFLWAVAGRRRTHCNDVYNAMYNGKILSTISDQLVISGLHVMRSNPVAQTSITHVHFR
jgi:hypothetical protein